MDADRKQADKQQRVGGDSGGFTVCYIEAHLAAVVAALAIVLLVPVYCQ